jgi:hypothetical protein
MSHQYYALVLVVAKYIQKILFCGAENVICFETSGIKIESPGRVTPEKSDRRCPVVMIAKSMS